MVAYNMRTHESFPCRWQYETDFMNHAADSQVFDWLSYILDLNSIAHAWHFRHYTSAIFHFWHFNLYIRVRYSSLPWRQKIIKFQIYIDFFYLKYYFILKNIFSLNRRVIKITSKGRQISVYTLFLLPKGCCQTEREM